MNSRIMPTFPSLCQCVSLCGEREEEMEALGQFSNASKLCSATTPSKAAANV